MKNIFQWAAMGSVIVLSVALVAWAWTRTQYPIRNAPAAGQTIVAFGDSLVVGTGAPTGADFVSLLSAHIERPIVNAGVAGDTTAAALARLDDIRKRKPDLVIVLLGGNDALQRVAVAQTLGNLRAIITRLQDDGAVVLLLGVRGGLIGDPYQREFAKLARELHAAYIPNILDGVWGNAQQMADEVHPNAIGYGVMAERAAPVVRRLVGLPE